MKKKILAAAVLCLLTACSDRSDEQVTIPESVLTTVTPSQTTVQSKPDIAADPYGDGGASTSVNTDVVLDETTASAKETGNDDVIADDKATASDAPAETTASQGVLAKCDSSADVTVGIESAGGGHDGGHEFAQ